MCRKTAAPRADRGRAADRRCWSFNTKASSSDGPTRRDSFGASAASSSAAPGRTPAADRPAVARPPAGCPPPSAHAPPPRGTGSPTRQMPHRAWEENRPRSHLHMPSPQLPGSPGTRPRTPDPHRQTTPGARTQDRCALSTSSPDLSNPRPNHRVHQVGRCVSRSNPSVPESGPGVPRSVPGVPKHGRLVLRPARSVSRHDLQVSRCESSVPKCGPVVWRCGPRVPRSGPFVSKGDACVACSRPSVQRRNPGVACT